MDIEVSRLRRAASPLLSWVCGPWRSAAPERAVASLFPTSILKTYHSSAVFDAVPPSAAFKSSFSIDITVKINPWFRYSQTLNLNQWESLRKITVFKSIIAPLIFSICAILTEIRWIFSLVLYWLRSGEFFHWCYIDWNSVIFFIGAVLTEIRWIFHWCYFDENSVNFFIGAIMTEIRWIFSLVLYWLKLGEFFHSCYIDWNSVIFFIDAILIAIRWIF